MPALGQVNAKLPASRSVCVCVCTVQPCGGLNGEAVELQFMIANTALWMLDSVRRRSSGT